METTNLENINQGGEEFYDNQQMGKENFTSYNPNGFECNNIKKIKPKIGTQKKRYNQYNSLMRASAPFNYYGNPNGTDGYAICYNGGMVKRFHPLVTRRDLSKYLKTRNAFGPRQQAFFQRPENYYLPKPNCVPNPVVDRLYNRSVDNFYPKINRRTNQNYSVNWGRPPFAQTTMNKRYSNSLMTPSGNERRNKGKIINYKLNYNDNLYNNSNCPQNCNNVNNEEVNNNINTINQNFVQKETQNKGNFSNNNPNAPKEKDLNNLNFNVSSSYKPKLKRRFHKVQIFNNFKPFLVEEFKEFDDYC